MNSMAICTRDDYVMVVLGEYRTGRVTSMVCLSDSENRQDMTYHRNGITSIQISHGDSPLVACGSFDRSVSIYQGGRDGLQILYILKQKHPVIKLDWNIHRHLLIVSYHHNSISIYDSLSSGQQMTKKVKQDGPPCLSPSTSLITTLSIHNGYILDSLFNLCNPSQVISCSDDHTVKATPY